jgi:subtilisin family serine protease
MSLGYGNVQAVKDAAHALTVGATTSADHEASFRNHGRCVDVLAPGVSIL